MYVLISVNGDIFLLFHPDVGNVMDGVFCKSRGDVRCSRTAMRFGGRADEGASAVSGSFHFNDYFDVAV